MSVVNAPYQNTSNNIDDDEDYYNDTMFTAIASSSYSNNNNNNLIDLNNIKPEKPTKPAKKTYFEVPGLTSGESLEDNYDERRDPSRNLSRYGEQNSMEDIEASEFLPTQLPNGGMTTGYTNQPSMTTTLWQNNLDKVPFKSGLQAKSNSLASNGVTTTVKTATTATSTTTTAATTTKTTTTTDKIAYTSAGTSTQMNGLATTTKQSTTPTPTPTTTAEIFTSSSRETESAEITETTSSIPTTPKAHSHHHHQHHHSGKPHRKHSNRQHRHRSQSHRRHNLEARPTHSNEYERSLEARTTKPIDFNSLDDITTSTGGIAGKTTKHLSIEVSASYEDIDYGRRSGGHNTKTTSTISTTTRDSAIHIVKPEMLPEIIPSTPVATNSKIIEIKTNERSRKVKRMADDEMQVEIEPEYLIGDAGSNESDTDQLSATPTDVLSATAAAAAANPNVPFLNDDGLVRLDGFSGMLQIFFGIEKSIDVAIFAQPPSAEFINLLFALLVWSVRYPAVFWSTTKPFATIFSVQIIAAALDIIFSYVGVSNLYKLQVYSEAMPVQNPGLILNGIVTLSLFLLSTILLLASSMIMYLYGHGRLAAKMRDRSLITMKTSETWIYFAHCASLCYVLALAVVKAPLLNDLSATYRSNLHCTTFLSALVSVAHILLWIVIWLGLTAKRRWTFKLPPLDTFGIAKASTQPLLMPNRGSMPSGPAAIMEQKTVMSTASSTDGVVEDIYWPKLTPSSPKLKVTFNEVTSTSDDVHLIGDQEQNDGKR